ncbi:hypothetical protein [Nocardia otitidiscaviarum]|uniref:hypothetical protein n=1 Tax=Nocardia otitidiscaviarum TaxID=1823 RepID=UPI001894F63D|nr:hypothetical protein [Nocardia otitidiscaviarum]MBF6178098.1 hypothetical protein [Nocardia otitidiscaviarum]
MTGHISYQHRDDGIWPVGEDGWPVTTEELRELDGEVRDALSLLADPEVIDVEPESVVDINAGDRP